MQNCEKCIHERACDSWKRHGETLYSDFSYNVEDCPFFSDRDAGKYIKLEDLQKFPIRKDHCDKEHGNEHFIYGIESVLEYAEYLPTYDVVPRSEVVKIFEEIAVMFRKYYNECSEPNELKLLAPLCQAERFIINEMWHDVSEHKKKYTEVAE